MAHGPHRTGVFVVNATRDMLLVTASGSRRRSPVLVPPRSSRYATDFPSHVLGDLAEADDLNATTGVHVTLAVYGHHIEPAVQALMRRPASLASKAIVPTTGERSAGSHPATQSHPVSEPVKPVDVKCLWRLEGSGLKVKTGLAWLFIVETLCKQTDNTTYQVHLVLSPGAALEQTDSSRFLLAHDLPPDAFPGEAVLTRAFVFERRLRIVQDNELSAFAVLGVDNNVRRLNDRSAVDAAQAAYAHRLSADPVALEILRPTAPDAELPRAPPPEDVWAALVSLCCLHEANTQKMGYLSTSAMFERARLAFKNVLTLAVQSSDALLLRSWDSCLSSCVQVLSDASLREMERESLALRRGITDPEFLAAIAKHPVRIVQMHAATALVLGGIGALAFVPVAGLPVMLIAGASLALSSSGAALLHNALNSAVVGPGSQMLPPALQSLYAFVENARRPDDPLSKEEVAVKMGVLVADVLAANAVRALFGASATTTAALEVAQDCMVDSRRVNALHLDAAASELQPRCREVRTAIERSRRSFLLSALQGRLPPRIVGSITGVDRSRQFLAEAASQSFWLPVSAALPDLRALLAPIDPTTGTVSLSDDTVCDVPVGTAIEPAFGDRYGVAILQRAGFHTSCLHVPVTGVGWGGGHIPVILLRPPGAPSRGIIVNKSGVLDAIDVFCDRLPRGSTMIGAMGSTAGSNSEAVTCKTPPQWHAELSADFDVDVNAISCCTLALKPKQLAWSSRLVVSFTYLPPPPRDAAPEAPLPREQRVHVLMGGKSTLRLPAFCVRDVLVLAQAWRPVWSNVVAWDPVALTYDKRNVPQIYFYSRPRSAEYETSGHLQNEIVSSSSIIPGNDVDSGDINAHIKLWAESQELECRGIAAGGTAESIAALKEWLDGAGRRLLSFTCQLARQQHDVTDADTLMTYIRRSTYAAMKPVLWDAASAVDEVEDARMHAIFTAVARGVIDPVNPPFELGDAALWETLAPQERRAVDSAIALLSSAKETLLPPEEYGTALRDIITSWGGGAITASADVRTSLLFYTLSRASVTLAEDPRGLRIASHAALLRRCEVECERFGNDVWWYSTMWQGIIQWDPR